MGIVNIILVIVGVTLIGLVLGISSYNEQAEAGGPIGGCGDFGEMELQHWDKIIFKPNQKLFNDSPSPLFPFVLSPNKIYDIKVVQDPLAVTDLQGTVSKFLSDSGYKTSGGSKVFPRFIEIVDVEYEIACVKPPFAT